MRSYPVKKNHIGSAVNEIIQYTQTFCYCIIGIYNVNNWDLVIYWYFMCSIIFVVKSLESPAGTINDPVMTHKRDYTWKQMVQLWKCANKNDPQENAPKRTKYLHHYLYLESNN